MNPINVQGFISPMRGRILNSALTTRTRVRMEVEMPTTIVMTDAKTDVGKGGGNSSPTDGKAVPAPLNPVELVSGVPGAEFRTRHVPLRPSACAQLI